MWIRGLLWLALSLGIAVPVQAEPRPVTLKSAAIADFAVPPPSGPPSLKPDFREKDFPLKDAENLKEIQAFIGALSPDEKAFLEKNRFLLRPKPAFLPASSGPDPQYDEMLAWFDALGGDIRRSERKPANARLVTPDVFLHAWHKYLESRRAAVERGPLLATARFMLAELYRNASELRTEAGAGAQIWERLMAQLLVPLILLDEAKEEEPAAAAQGPQRALARFEPYRAQFSPAMAKNIRAELVRVYRAETREVGLLGLAPVDGGQQVDYSRFKPPAIYAGDAAGRAYYRAVTWLSRLGWDARTESGLADALNCSLAMSYDGKTEAAGSPPAAGPAAADPKIPAAAAGLDNPRQAWARFMEISAFFQGYPESSSYLEWLPFLMKESGVPEFTATTGSDKEVLRRLAVAADIISAPVRPYFKDWPSPPAGKGRIMCVVPQRRTPLELIEAEFRRRGEADDGLPLVSSALWLPALMGHREARAMLPRQTALTRNRAERPLSSAPENAAEALNGRLDRLAARLKSEPEAAWQGTLAASRLKLMSTLAGPFDSGYPLYMRSAAFPAKRLESISGAYAELRHGAGLPAPAAAEPAPAPAANFQDGQSSAPLVKGLVEPNPEFWREMIRSAEYARSGFRKYGLFPEDLEDFGSLTRFIKRLERCAALTEKELAGQELSEDDYEFIRLFSLGWMALPPGGDQGGQPAEERVRAGLVTAFQELPPEIEGGLVVYQATGEPWLMLALTGNEKSPRLVMGLAYSHYEFAGPFEPLLTDPVWQLAAYARYRSSPAPGGPYIPARNFWYEALKP